MTGCKIVTGLLLGTMLTGPALAQDNMEKLGNMQKTGATFTFVEQGGYRAEAL